MEGQSFSQDPISSLLAEFGTRLNEIEEKQRLLKDRVLLIGENLISSKEELEKDNLDFRKRLNQVEFELKSSKQLLKRIVDEIGNFARKSELDILERQFKMFQPLALEKDKDTQE